MFRKASFSDTRTSVPVVVEGLEQRQLLSATILNRVLIVDSTPYNDMINISTSGPAVIAVQENTNPVRFFPAAAIDSIQVRAFAGHDRVILTSAVNLPARVYCDTGNDSVAGGSGNDFIHGGDGNDYLLGYAGNDILDGWNGDDYLHGVDGDDRVYGFSGRDVMSGGNGNDSMFGEGDGDFMNGNAGNDILYGGTGNDNMSGEAGLDCLYGGLDHDNLNGGDGDDVLSGEAGNDVLTGAAGCDDLFGGDGDDYFYAYDGEEDYVDGGLGFDTAEVDDPFWPWSTHDTVLNCEVAFQP